MWIMRYISNELFMSQVFVTILFVQSGLLFRTILVAYLLESIVMIRNVECMVVNWKGNYFSFKHNEIWMISMIDIIIRRNI